MKENESLKVSSSVQGSQLHIAISDESIVYQYEWNTQNLSIREDIPLLKATRENLEITFEDMQKRYKLDVELYYANLSKKHIEASMPKIERYIKYLIGENKE